MSGRVASGRISSRIAMKEPATMPSAPASAQPQRPLPPARAVRDVDQSEQHQQDAERSPLMNTSAEVAIGTAGTR